MNAIEQEVLVAREGSVGHISLNRPKALNSLTLDMVRRINDALDALEEDPHVAAVLMSGEGERGFCAGGDIRMLYESGRGGSNTAVNFFREEYRLNARIARYPKPFIAIVDGITMGGGVGLSAHGSHRIATERTRLAMPETGIGFFPDVGATWLLSHAPGELGTFLGLTGEQIGVADAIVAELADFFVPSCQLSAVRDALSALAADANAEAVGRVIARFAQTPTEAVMARHRHMIDRAFAFDRVEEILVALEEEDGEFAAKTRQTLLAKSPSSLKVTLRLLRQGRESRDLESCLEREFAATAAVLRSHDFYEGVRAAVIDKDRNPKWSPHDLATVDEEAIAHFFASRAERLFV
ncbi:enoyl-CoA hydratase [Mesorhizobium sp. J18]|uniref:enoyl-CoA hydratase/isomerase family protein n=1 Tax=Mesorhizobium sp. J18 TaxID=935263 RepID=UPI00119C5FDF|nr:enoyl-CoA hydratase/isomerase family protein [Mesorhizobium sp. J18]TWG95977.1 enoyl-CoA hydratase [Mesorhizobium sp. J18]